MLANELLDNVPFHRVRRQAERVFEIYVGVSDGGFVEVEAECDKELARLARPILPGEEKAVSPSGLAMIDRVARVLSRGYALFIDYGPEAGVHGYRSQRMVADVLENPGSSDITSGVDFDALVRRAQDWDLRVWPLARQEEALRGLGFDRVMEAELRRQVAGARAVGIRRRQARAVRGGHRERRVGSGRPRARHRVPARRRRRDLVARTDG